MKQAKPSAAQQPQQAVLLYRGRRRHSRARAESHGWLTRTHRSPSHAREVMSARLVPRDRSESANITPSTAGSCPEPPEAGRTRDHRTPKNP